jgi:hypothetical protein
MKKLNTLLFISLSAFFGIAQSYAQVPINVKMQGNLIE